MNISGFSKLTLLDFPGHMACMVFTKGCNWKCSYCHNSSLVLDKELELIDHEEIFNYLIKRKGILEGLVISGGEPLIQKDIKEFIIKAKELGYLVKIDTNGSNPNKLKELIDEKLIDYVAMDIKNDFHKYNLTTDSIVNIKNVKKSIEILKENKVDYEFRTTIIKEYHNLDDIKQLLEITKGSKYFIQNFKDGDSVIKSGLHSFKEEELWLIYDSYHELYPNMLIRDLDYTKGRK